MTTEDLQSTVPFRDKSMVWTKGPPVCLTTDDFIVETVFTEVRRIYT